VLALYSYDPNPDDTAIENVVRQSMELIARLPVIVAHAYAVKRHYFDGESLYLHVPQEHMALAENFLHMLRRDNQFTPEEAHLRALMHTIHAEHAAATLAFTAACVLHRTDTYGAISGPSPSLKGPLHGGANKKVMEMSRMSRPRVDPTSDAPSRLSAAGARQEAGDGSGKSYGLAIRVHHGRLPRPTCSGNTPRNGGPERLRRGLSADGAHRAHGIEVLGEKAEAARPCAPCGHIFPPCVPDASFRRAFTRLFLPPRA
jgi:citrate synthase